MEKNNKQVNTTISQSCTNNENYKSNENEMLTEKEKFIKIIDTHLNYLVELRQQKSSKLLESHRSKIMQTTQAQMYWSYMTKCMSYKDFRSCCDYLRDTLCWERITGVKQLSIFDDNLPIMNEV